MLRGGEGEGTVVFETFRHGRSSDNHFGCSA